MAEAADLVSREASTEPRLAPVAEAMRRHASTLRSGSQPT